MGDSNVGVQARLMSQAMRKLTGSISKSKCMVIFINQIRMKIGVMFGSPETTTGGNALKFYSSVRLDIRRIGAIKDREEVVGNQTRVKVVKTKLLRPLSRSNLISCMAKVFPRLANYWILGSRLVWLINLALGTVMGMNVLVKVEKTPRIICGKPNCCYRNRRQDTCCARA